MPPQPESQPSMSTKAWIFLIALSILWGGSFFFNGVGVLHLEPFWIVFLRVAIGALGLVCFNLVAGHHMPRALPIWRDLAIMGLLNNAIPFGLIVWGQTAIGSGVAAVLNATTPLFAVLLAAWLIHEKLVATRVIGVIAGLAGVAVMIGPSSSSGGLGEGLGQLAICGAAVSYAFAGIWGRRLRELPVSVSAAGMLICSSLLILPLALASGPLVVTGKPVSLWLAMLGLGLACTSVAYLLYFRILRLAGATNLMLVTFLVPVSALVLGMGFLGERPGLEVWIGMALIFAGLALVDGRLFRRGGTT